MMLTIALKISVKKGKYTFSPTEIPKRVLNYKHKDHEFRIAAWSLPNKFYVKTNNIKRFINWYSEHGYYFKQGRPDLGNALIRYLKQRYLGTYKKYIN